MEKLVRIIKENPFVVGNVKVMVIISMNQSYVFNSTWNMILKKSREDEDVGADVNHMIEEI